MIEILVSKEVDNFSFNRLTELATRLNVRLLRAAAQKDLFVPISDDVKSFTIADSLLSCYKAISRIKEVSKTL